MSAPNDETERLDRLVELEQALAQERAARKSDIDAAFEEGRAKGREEADDLAKQRLDELRRGIATASADCVGMLEKKTDLAVLIAREGLSRILGDTALRVELVQGVVRRAFADLTSDAVLAVRVSAEDFADSEALNSLAPDGVDIVCDEKLGAGSCIFELRLGTIDASLSVQAQALDWELSHFEIPPGDAR